MSQFNHNLRCVIVPVVTGTCRYGISNSVIPYFPNLLYIAEGLVLEQTSSKAQ